MKQKLLNKLWLRVGMIVAIMTTALAGTMKAQTVSVNDVLWSEPFQGTNTSTAFSATSSWGDYVNPTTFVAADANSLNYSSSNAMLSSATGANMNGAHAWLNKKTTGYIQVSGIKLYNATKVKAHFSQGGSGTVTVYYQFDGSGNFASLSANTSATADYESYELNVAGHTTIALKFQRTSNNNNLRIDNLKLAVTEIASSEPSISADNVNIAYNATSGSIAYTLSNATGNVSATVTTGDWLTLGTITSTGVPFTCSANTGSTARTAQVTLSYAGATDKVVTVTQAVNPNLSNIAALTSQTAGEYSVSLTDALVTYINGNYAYLEDASGAVMLFKCSDGLAVGDKITGTANVTYTVFNGLPEVTAFELATGYTKTSGNTVTPTTVTIADLIGNNASNYLSRYVKIEGATVTSAFSNRNSTIEQSGSSIVLRDQNSSATLTTTANTIVTVTAHPSIYNSTHQIAVYEQSQIEVAKVDPTITFNNGTVRVGQSIDLTSLFTSNSDGEVTYTITAGDSYATHNTDDSLTGVAEGTVTVKAEQAATDAFNAGEATATITVNPALVLSSIAVTTAPTTTTYDEGDYFDPTGMVVTATYTDNSTEAVTDYTYTPDGALTTSDTEITISYTENNVTKTTTQAITVNEVHDYATLPFEWAGGLSSALTEVTGVTANGIGDYPNQTTYQVKLDGTGDYIQIKTDSQPGTVTIGVKMVGGASASSITVQESVNGSDFTDVETLSISGSQNSTLTLETSNAFASTTRYVRLYFNKGSNVGVGPITIAKASTDPVINANASVELTAETTSGEIAYTISNPVGGTSLTAAENPDVDWISNVIVANDKVTFTTTVNTGSERTATITLTYGSVTKDVTVTQAEHVDINTYTLVSVITSGKHYVIAATTNSTTVAMGGKNASKDYYDAVDDEHVSLSGTTLSVASNLGVREFIIYGPDADGYYTIYDPVAGGYLYASSDGSNDLSYQTSNDDNGRWEIDFTNETVTAQGTNSHNLLRYNSSNPRFSCYTSGQTAVQFYEKDGEATPTESKTLNASGYATYCSENALDFTGNSDVTAWVITAANSTTGVITFSQIEGKVPAGTGMLLKGSASASVNITSATGTVAAPSSNLLEGTLASKEVAADEYYGLSGNEFVKVNAGTVPAGKALLPASALGSNVKAFTFVFEDDATGINEELRMKNEESSIYNLAGQRISKMQKGINIVNGKKILK